jgi:ComF family protein
MLDQILSLLFPEHCRGCRISGTALCAVCLNTIAPAAAIMDRNTMAFFDYGNPIVQNAIWELKYHRKSAAAKVLALQAAKNISEDIASLLQSASAMPIVLVPVPQHYTKTFSRGFNQSTVIAQWLQKGLPSATVHHSMLDKKYATAAQAKSHGRSERQKNLHNSMECRATLDHNTLYIVVDDVITTGSTVHEASRALGAAGARHICAIALAHGYARR